MPPRVLSHVRGGQSPGKDSGYYTSAEPTPSVCAGTYYYISAEPIPSVSASTNDTDTRLLTGSLIMDGKDEDCCISPLKIWANTFERHESMAYRFEQPLHTPFHDRYAANEAGTSGRRMHELTDLLDRKSLSDSRHINLDNRISTCDQEPYERMLNEPHNATSTLEKAMDQITQRKQPSTCSLQSTPADPSMAILSSLKFLFEIPDTTNLSDLNTHDTQHGIQDYICSSISPTAVPEKLSKHLKASENSIERASDPLDLMTLAQPMLSTDTPIGPVDISLSSISEASRISSEESGSCCELHTPEEITSHRRQQELLLITLIGATRHRLINRLMSQFGLRHGEVYCEATEGAEQHAVTPTSQSGSGVMSSMNQSDPATPRRKGRTRQSDGNDEDSNENRRRKTRPNPDISLATTRRFACPYYKRDSSGFQKSTGFGPCAGPGWIDIAKLKEHLYRRHHRLLQCHRCKLPFDSQNELDRHAESTTPCGPRARQLQDGFTIEVFLIIQRKKKSFPGQTEEEKWKEIYQLLFPDVEVPSPYYANEHERTTQSYTTQPTSSLEQYGSSLSNEFRSRAMALVADAMRPLETQLSHHVSTLMEDSRQAISLQYLPLNGKSPGNYSMNGSFSNLSSSLLSSPQSLTFSQDVDPSSQITAAGSGSEHPAFSPIDFDFDTFLESDGMSNEPPRRCVGTTSPDSGFASNPSCSCNGICHCQEIFDRRLPTTIPSIQSHGIASLTNESIINLLQNLSRDVSELKQNLNSKK